MTNGRGNEATLSEPVQATTQIWGDGIAGNGCPPTKNGAVLTCNNANDVLNAGDVVVLRNNVPLPRVPANQLYDGRDKFGSTKALAVTRAQWDTAVTTRLGVTVDVYDTSVYGTSFTMPAGENLATDLGAFDFARLFRHGRTGQHCLYFQDHQLHVESG